MGFRDEFRSLCSKLGGKWREGLPNFMQYCDDAERLPGRELLDLIRAGGGPKDTITFSITTKEDEEGVRRKIFGIFIEGTDKSYILLSPEINFTSILPKLKPPERRYVDKMMARHAERVDRQLKEEILGETLGEEYKKAGHCAYDYAGRLYCFIEATLPKDYIMGEPVEKFLGLLLGRFSRTAVIGAGIIRMSDIAVGKRTFLRE